MSGHNRCEGRYGAQFLGIRLPVTFDTCEIIEERWANWLRQDPVVAIETRADNLRRLTAAVPDRARPVRGWCRPVEWSGSRRGLKHAASAHCVSPHRVGSRASRSKCSSTAGHPFYRRSAADGRRRVDAGGAYRGGAGGGRRTGEGSGSWIQERSEAAAESAFGNKPASSARSLTVASWYLARRYPRITENSTASRSVTDQRVGRAKLRCETPGVNDVGR
jgi:hypothetical protein